MNKQQLITDIKALIQSREDYEASVSGLGLHPDGELHRAFYGVFNKQIELLNRIFNQPKPDRLDYGWIDWFIFENDCGRNKREAGYGDQTTPIENVEQLADLMLVAAERGE